LLATGPGQALTLADFQPRDPQVLETARLDADPAELALLVHPSVRTFRLPGEPVVERVPFAFDTAFATRSVSGEVQVFRVRGSGVPALAATAPMRCAGAVRVAERAPVLVCPTDEGFARWDLRRAREGEAAVDASSFQASAVEVSPDGARVAAIAGRSVLVTSPDDPKGHAITAASPVVLARWSPRDPVLALVEAGQVEIVATDGRVLLRYDGDAAPVDARWDPGGLDLAVCVEGGGGRFTYLRSGGRTHDDALAPSAARPCDPPPDPHRPALVTSASEVPELEGRDLGPHPIVGGFRLPDGRLVTRDLVLLRKTEPALATQLAFHGRDSAGGDDPHGELASVAAVVRDGADVAFQLGDEIRIYDTMRDRRILERRGHLVRRCADGRLLAWEAKGATYRAFDVRSDATLGEVARAPGLVVGADARCSRLYTQKLDGTLLAEPFDGSGARTLAVADGFVFDARPARGSIGTGLWIGVGSGAIARIDDVTLAVRVAAYASPVASAIGDGPRPGDLAYADATGVTIVRPDGVSERVLDAANGTVWEDLSTAPDGSTMLLAADDKLAVLDLAAKEIVGTAPVETGGRLTPWDREGSVFAWSFSRVGGADGVVVPRARGLAASVGRRVSNLVVVDGRVVLRR
jgi:hypothetical protein